MTTEAFTDGTFVPDHAPCRDGRAVDDILKVSVMSLSGSVLGTAPVSSKGCVWELKSSIVLAIPQLHMHQRRITLMHGPQILADATPVHEVGIVNGTVLSVILAPAYNMLGRRGDVAELWNHEGRLDGVFFGHTSEINTVNFSPDVTLAITSSWDCSAKLWQVASQVCLFTLRHEVPVDTATFNLTGTTVLTATLLHEMKLWCVSSGHCVSTLSLHGHGQSEFAFTSQGVNVLHTRAHCIALWNMETGTRLWKHHSGFAWSYEPLTCLSTCGNWLCTVISGRQNIVDIWNATTSSHYGQVAQTRGHITDMSFSPDAWRLVVVCTNGNVTVWNLGRDRRSYTFKHESTVRSAVFSTDGHQLITIAAGSAWLWVVDDHTVGWCIPQAQVSMAFFTPDSKGVLLTGRTGTEEWDTASMELCWKVDGEPITGIAFSSQNEGLGRD